MLIDWLSPDELDMSGEPESFVLLPAGRRLPVLAHARRGSELQESACRFLDANRCTVYRARPSCCRTFPVELDGEGDPAKQRLTLLPDAACPGVFDGPDRSAELRRSLLDRSRELREHVELVQEWNRRQRRRRLANRRIESAAAFLAFAVLRAGGTKLRSESEAQ